MRELAHAVGTAVFTTLILLGACQQRETPDNAVGEVALADRHAEACGGDSVRPATGAPASGLWLYEWPSGGRVAALIGQMRASDRDLAMVRAVETVEVSSAGDTIRHRVVAAAVSLQLLPPLGPAAPGDSAVNESIGSRTPAATYVVSSRVWIAAYEACDTNLRG